MPFQYIVCKFRIYAIYCYDILILTLYFELCNFLNYQKLEHFIYLLKKNIYKYPNFKSFLWSLELRGIYGKNYDVLDKEEFSELKKL